MGNCCCWPANSRFSIDEAISFGSALTQMECEPIDHKACSLTLAPHPYAIDPFLSSIRHRLACICADSGAAVISYLVTTSLAIAEQKKNP